MDERGEILTNKIKFSHEYNKLPIADLRAFLLEIFTVEKRELSEHFIDYDTRYSDWKWKGDLRVPEVKNYPLPNGKVLVLLLLSESQKKMFTTIRRWTPEKEKYYRSKIGEVFEIEINERED